LLEFRCCATEAKLGLTNGRWGSIQGNLVEKTRRLKNDAEQLPAHSRAMNAGKYNARSELPNGLRDSLP
jgi:hypothetical protein